MTLIHADLTEGLVEGGTQMSISEQNFAELVALIGASKLHCMEAVRGAGAADFGMWLAQNMQHMHGQYQKLREEHFAAEENIKNGVNPGEVPANDEADTSRLPAHEQNP
ncbi:MAG: hypothetical protein GY752_08885 [bacterium]|nr:hypothetical protein [bacterium]